jgi:cell wall-associated NlpC family hydrolase
LPIWRDAECSAVERQLVYGDLFTVYEDLGEMAFGQSKKDGYVGYVRADGLRDPATATHLVSSRATHLYPKPDVKAATVRLLSFGSAVRVIGREGAFSKTFDGLFVPAGHLSKIDTVMPDPVSVATLFLGTPYLWGGNSCCGIDCSGLVQAAFLACGIACPGDSDLQEQEVGRTIDQGVSTKRGDLFFWKGHVAMALDDQVLVHANAHHMAVVIEPIKTAVERIAEQGGGPVTSRKRV